MTTNQNKSKMLSHEENKSYWSYSQMLEGNKYYEKQWSDLRKKMNNKNYKQWEEWKK